MMHWFWIVLLLWPVNMQSPKVPSPHYTCCAPPPHHLKNFPD